ncbi:MAG: hypothetical protein KA392_14060 [Candidatus Obscuribacter sp.]|nr:hypothetical protein [Candidatus Obscuribacter sp.]
MAQTDKPNSNGSAEVVVPDLSTLQERAYSHEQTAAVKKLLEETQKDRRAPGSVVPAEKSDGKVVQSGDAAPKAKDGPVALGDAAQPKASDGAIGRPKDAFEASRVGYLHQTLSNLMPAYEGANLNAHQQELKTGLQKEMAEQRFGPATRELYGDYVRWLEQKALPQEVGRQVAYGLPVQASEHFKVTKEGAISLNLPTDKAPDDAQLERLDGAYRWLAANIKDSDQKEKALVAAISGQMQDAVRTLGLPRGWLPEAAAPGSDDINKPWLQNSARLMRSALQVSEYVELLDDLKRSSSGDFPGDMPPGATLVRDDRGRVKTINLDLPQSWKLDTEEDRQKIERLEKWVTDKKQLLEPIKEQLKQLHFYPELVPSQDDLETKGRGVQFDASGRIANFVDLKAATASGVQGQHFNLASSRFDVEQRDGKVVMTQSVQLKDVPVWGYLNSFGVTDVGKPMVMTREYKPDEYVVVRKGHEFELVQARNLKSDGLVNGVKRAAETALPVAMDAGMLAVGATEVVASLRAGKPAPLLGLLRGGTRTVVGGTGIFNNAGARETEWGANVNLARSTYFVADVGYSTARTTMNWLRGAQSVKVAAAETIGVGAAKSEGARVLPEGAQLLPGGARVLPDGAKLLPGGAKHLPEGAKQLSTMIDNGALSLTAKTGNVLLYGAGVGYVPLIASDLVTQATRLKTDPTKIIERQARRQGQGSP